MEQGKSILVAEDNEVNQMVVGGMLNKLGYVFDIVSNGQEAVDKVGAGGFDVILMDCRMPVMDGYRATEVIRRNEPQNSRIPIIALTAHAFDEDRESCLSAGMDDFLPKPITIAALRDTLSKWL